MPPKRRTTTKTGVKIVIITLGSMGIITDYLKVIVPFVVSLGIIGFAFTFALQYPVANFMRWIYVMTSKTFKVSDSVRIGERGGQVLSIEYLMTTIAEFDSFGKLSGRILTIPNSTVLTTQILNWINQSLFWDSVSFTLAYESDLKHVQEIMLATVKNVIEEQNLNPAIQKYVQSYRETGFNYDTINNEPYIILEPIEGGRVRARLIYLVPLEINLKIKTILTERILEIFNR